MRDVVPDLTETLRAYVGQRLLSGRAVAADEDLLLSGLLDSLAVMSLVAEAERVAGVLIPPEDVTIENFTSVASLAAYLAGRAQGSP